MPQQKRGNSSDYKQWLTQESSCMDLFQGQINIILRIIDKYNYSIFFSMMYPLPMRAGDVHT